MIDRLRHRGPDGQGFYSAPGVTLGHCRLAILDLSAAGSQPMSLPGDRGAIVFNGCIYNYRELREELRRRGRVFRSDCDTEVLVHGYDEWGIDQLTSRLRGMFAFAVWDNPEKTLWLVRDRLGVKPLVYSVFNGGLAFASTLTGLQPGIPEFTLSEEAILEFLSFGFITNERSIASNVYKVPPGCIIRWRDGEISKQNYWSLLPSFGSLHLGFREAVERSEELLLDAVQMRLRADVPMASTLSGGIDSALICWALKKLGADVKVYTLSLPGDASDETNDAVQTARHLDLDHRLIRLPRVASSLLESTTNAYSEPFASESALGMMVISACASKEVKVVFTGDGADDVFLGYPFFRADWIAQCCASSIPDGAVTFYKTVRPWLPASCVVVRKLRTLMDLVATGQDAHGRSLNSLPYYVANKLIGQRLRSFIHEHGWQDTCHSGRFVLADVFQYHFGHHFQGEFLVKVDESTMYYGIEARSPFLDQEIWEFASKLPVGILLHHGELKAVLKDIVSRRIGVNIAARRKRGFTVPIERLLAGPWRYRVELLCDSSCLTGDGWVEQEALRQVALDSLDKEKVPAQLWRLIVLESWLQQRRNLPAVRLRREETISDFSSELVGPQV